MSAPEIIGFSAMAFGFCYGGVMLWRALVEGAQMIWGVIQWCREPENADEVHTW
jgi:hypothetical protein